MTRKRADGFVAGEYDHYMRFLSFSLETCVRNMKGGQEKWVWIMDMAGEARPGAGGWGGGSGGRAGVAALQEERGVGEVPVCVLARGRLGFLLHLIVLSTHSHSPIHTDTVLGCTEPTPRAKRYITAAAESNNDTNGGLAAV